MREMCWRDDVIERERLIQFIRRGRHLELHGQRASRQPTRPSPASGRHFHGGRVLSGNSSLASAEHDEGRIETRAINSTSSENGQFAKYCCAKKESGRRNRCGASGRRPDGETSFIS